MGTSCTCRISGVRSTRGQPCRLCSPYPLAAGAPITAALAAGLGECIAVLHSEAEYLSFDCFSIFVLFTFRSDLFCFHDNEVFPSVFFVFVDIFRRLPRWQLVRIVRLFPE